MSDIETTGFWATLLIVSDWAIRLVMLPIVPTRRSPEASMASRAGLPKGKRSTTSVMKFTGGSYRKK